MAAALSALIGSLVSGLNGARLKWRRVNGARLIA